MSPKQLLTHCLLLSGIFTSAQKTIETSKATETTTISHSTIEQLPFQRDFNEFTIQRNFDYMRTKPENSSGHTTDINLNIDYNHFIADHVGIGVDLNLASSKAVYNNATTNSTTTTKISDWMAYANIIYGTTFSNNFNLYGKLSVGFGQFTGGSGSTSSAKENQFGYKIEIGAPVHLFNDGGNYFTPFINYNYLQQKNGGEKFTDNEFSFGFMFQNYGPCNNYQCDCHHGRLFSDNMYGQGRSFIGSSMGNFGFGKSKYNYNNSSYNTDISGGMLNFEYGYYFIPNIAIGAGVSWDDQTQKTVTKYTTSDLLFTPMLTLNLPAKNCANNLFLRGGYGFGFEKVAASTEQKTNLTKYGFNLGFNDFFGKHIALTPKIGYGWERFKNTTTNAKVKWSGLEFSLGSSLHF
jgi:hypothetical protein